MNKPVFDPNQPFQEVNKPPFNPDQPFTASPNKTQEPSFMGINKRNLPETISTIQRPLMEGGGALAGAALASPGIVTTPLGGAVGFASGKAGADLIDRLLGVKKPLQNTTQALIETAGNVKKGAEAEMAGQIGGKILSSARKPIGKFIGNLGRVASGVKSEIGTRLFNDPGALFTPSTEISGQKLGAIRNEMGMVSKPGIDEIVDSEASTARKTIKEVYEKMKAGTAKALDLLKGAQASDDVIQATPMKQANKRRMLFEQKREFTDALKNVAPEERAAAADYARSALGSEFRKFFPVTKSGDVSILRTLGLGAMEGGGKLMAAIPSLLQSPALTGLGISSAGEFYKLLSHPQVRRGIISALADIRNK